MKQRAVTLPSAFDASLQAAKFYNESLINGGSKALHEQDLQKSGAPANKNNQNYGQNYYYP